MQSVSMHFVKSMSPPLGKCFKHSVSQSSYVHRVGAKSYTLVFRSNPETINKDKINKLEMSAFGK